MNCVIYMDVFFFVNFWVDLLLIFILRYFIKKRRTVSCILAALIGAALTTGILLLYLKLESVVVLAFGAITLTTVLPMIAFGCRKLLWHSLLLFMEGAVLSSLISGTVFILSSLEIRTEKLSDALILIIVFFSATVGCLLLERQSKLQWKEENYKAKMVLEFADRRVLATALIDTGNKLYDPFYHKPVILVEKSIIEKTIQLCRQIYPEKLQYIPFYSIGREKGVLTGVLLDYVSIRWKERTWQFSSVIAASVEDELCKGKEYQVIFHCGLFEEAS